MKWNDNDAVAVLKCVACGWTFEEILLRGDDVPDCEECAERGEQANTYVRSSRPYGVPVFQEASYQECGEAVYAKGANAVAVQAGLNRAAQEGGTS